MSKEKFQIKNQWILVFMVLFIYIFVTRSPVSHTTSDPKGNLALSQIIIQDQSIKLDRYKDSKYISNFLVQYNDHYYYFFPLGTAISSIPFVLFETYILHNDMSNQIHDKNAQKFIAGIISVIIFIILYFIAMLYLSENLSLIISFTFWLGTSLSSTLGQALWMQNFATLYALLSIFIMLKIIKEDRDNYWMILGLALFMAYLTRPTLSLLSVAVIAFIFLNNKKLIAIKIGVVVGVFLGLFVLFSLHEFDQFLPYYYMPKRLSSETFWIAFYGNLLSPARGILIFSPFLFLFIVDAKNTYKLFRDDKSLLVILLWIFLHLIIISKFPHWWAGYSYGARFMLDILPAIFLLFIILLSYIEREKHSIKKRLISIFLVITISMSIYFNAIQGLYNIYSGSLWNSSPSIDKNPKYLFNWEYPQFLHNKQRHQERLDKFKASQ